MIWMVKDETEGGKDEGEMKEEEEEEEGKQKNKKKGGGGGEDQEEERMTGRGKNRVCMDEGEWRKEQEGTKKKK